MGMSLACIVAFFEHYLEKRKRKPVSVSTSRGKILLHVSTKFKIEISTFKIETQFLNVLTVWKQQWAFVICMYRNNPWWNIVPTGTYCWWQARYTVRKWTSNTAGPSGSRTNRPVSDISPKLGQWFGYGSWSVPIFLDVSSRFKSIKLCRSHAPSMSNTGKWQRNHDQKSQIATFKLRLFVWFYT